MSTPKGKKQRDILVEFEKRYRRNPAETMDICAAIARDFHMDVDEVADYVYIYRYNDNCSLDKSEDL